MRRQSLFLLVVCLVLTMFAPQALPAAVHPASTTPTTEKPVASAEATQLLRRLDEIKAMDKSELSKSQKKELRKEVKGIKKELRAVGGGVYLSTAAIIIIALLLILLL